METNKKLRKLFPLLKTNTINKFKIDDESIYYISSSEIADIISNIIIKHLDIFGLDKDNIVITDCTAGVGGNTMSFANTFKYVNSIELSELRCQYLKNNLNIFGFRNVDIYNGDCIKIINNIEKNDVVFIDPPWGGKDYKKIKNIKCSLSNIPIEILCNNIINKAKNDNPPYFVVFKLPKNYDLNHFNKYILSNQIYIHTLKKMLIIIVYNNTYISSK